jgi:hypothetical protein
MPTPSPKLDFPPRKQRPWRERFLADWHYFTARFTRENVIINLKTLAWVIPLTLLIWIYAERAQVTSIKDVAIPFELISVDPNRVVTLKPPQDKNLLVQLEGPRARLQDVLAKLRGGLLPQGLKIEVPTTLEVNQEHGLDVLPRVSNQKIFVDSGVSVSGCQPARLQVRVDALVEREAKIIRPPGARNVDASFTPPTVKVRGPLEVLNRAEQRGGPENAGQLVLLADLRDQINSPPGSYEVKDVVLRRPAELEDERVTILVPSPSGIRAQVDVRKAEKTLLIRSMPITFDTPESFFDKYKVVWERPKAAALQNITVTGPPEIIDAMERPDFEPKPKAHVILTQQDATAGDIRTKPVKFDLPDKVQVLDEHRNQTVELRLVDKATAGPG